MKPQKPEQTKTVNDGRDEGAKTKFVPSNEALKNGPTPERADQEKTRLETK